MESIKAEFIGLADGQEHSFTIFWNSESRFVVAGANDFTKLQQTDILEYFSKYRICNCVIVSRLLYVTDTDYSSLSKVNDVETDMKLMFKLGFHIRVLTVVLR